MCRCNITSLQGATTSEVVINVGDEQSHIQMASFNWELLRSYLPYNDGQEGACASKLVNRIREVQVTR